MKQVLVTETSHRYGLVRVVRSVRRLSAKSVVVLGKVNGSIQASELVCIGDAGSVEGAISAPRLAVADGAQLQGRVDM